MEKLKELPKIFRRKATGYIHQEIYKDKKIVIHELSDSGAVRGWEIGKLIKKSYPYPLESGELTHYEYKWKDEDSGTLAWYYPTYDKDKLEIRKQKLLS